MWAIAVLLLRHVTRDAATRRLNGAEVWPPTRVRAAADAVDRGGSGRNGIAGTGIRTIASYVSAFRWGLWHVTQSSFLPLSL